VTNARHTKSISFGKLVTGATVNEKCMKPTDAGCKPARKDGTNVCDEPEHHRDGQFAWIFAKQ
jgi:hypothetical protein